MTLKILAFDFRSKGPGGRAYSGYFARKFGLLTEQKIEDDDESDLLEHDDPAKSSQNRLAPVARLTKRSEPSTQNPDKFGSPSPSRLQQILHNANKLLKNRPHPGVTCKPVQVHIFTLFYQI